MVDDARTRLRERMAKVEQRALAWVHDRRPDLREKNLVEVIAALREEERHARLQALAKRRETSFQP